MQEKESKPDGKFASKCINEETSPNRVRLDRRVPSLTQHFSTQVIHKANAVAI